MPAIEASGGVLRGARQIADFLGVSKRQVYFLLEGRRIPAFRLGAIWCLRIATYEAFVAELEAEAIALVAGRREEDKARQRRGRPADREARA